MTDKLLELAQKWGVEAWEVPNEGCGVHGCCGRPRLDIAHDLLAKLAKAPQDFRIWGGCWDYWADNDWQLASSFESAVIALAERSGK